MCIIDNFYEDLFFDLEYQEWLRDQQLQQRQQWEYEYHIEQQAYDKMAEEYFKDLEKFQTLTMEKEYRNINEWDELQAV
jgi:hypothetical protein